MNKDAQQILALGLAIMFIAMGIGSCDWLIGHAGS